ncbi:hypothetical protein KIN20_016024 [Parelaphostrongylus tenuis]|uniref:Phlebovirus glycoprotein G2 fusion domain-containing protein n=1 Tax=Parelaphostrongylus tenuis TaxID=148309 RepID=A0AAD5QPF7_PARTN|nr:hypothetical protein KIN20_016024 [Parelaphostrongylus tenuis]
MILSLLTLLLSTTQCADASTSIRQLECIGGGVKISSPDRAPYELCAEGYCKIYETPEDEEIVHLPPQIVLHDYKVQWKITSNITMGIIETTCAAASFCEHVNCIFCSATMFNPECWPLGAISATTIYLYLIITSCYVFLFVPVTLGKPIRLFTSFIWRLIRSRFNNVPMNRRHQTRHRQQHADITKLLLAVTMTIIIPTEACQQVNLFSHSTTICQNVNGTHICKVKISDVLKTNPFKREVCFRLFKNETLLQEIRLTWNSLTLSCEPETDLFTRDTSYRVVDSKICPHTGSCTRTTCANITPSSLLPELEEGNIYPGVTACTKSCEDLDVIASTGIRDAYSIGSI